MVMKLSKFTGHETIMPNLPGYEDIFMTYVISSTMGMKLSNTSRYETNTPGMRLSCLVNFSLLTPQTVPVIRENIHT